MINKSDLTPGYYWATSRKVRPNKPEPPMFIDYMVKVFGEPPFLKTKIYYLGEQYIINDHPVFDDLTIIEKIEGPSSYPQIEIKHEPN